MKAHALDRKSVAQRQQKGDEVIQRLATFLQKTHHDPEGRFPYLVSSTGDRQEVPSDVYKMLVYIVEALSAGQGITVMPTNAQLTTQQAADHLGMSRPTLVKLLECGEIPFTRIGRHRRVLFEDLIKYERNAHIARLEALDDLAIADGTYFSRPKTIETR